MRNSPNFSLADEVIVRALEAGAFPSACLLVGRDERVLYRRAYGRLSIEDDAPLTNEHTRYDLASVTKPLVVGMLTLRAMEAGKLCLWDRLGTFLDAPPDKRDITIAQILTHTAGFPTGLHGNCRTSRKTAPKRSSTRRWSPRRARGYATAARGSFCWDSCWSASTAWD